MFVVVAKNILLLLIMNSSRTMGVKNNYCCFTSTTTAFVSRIAHPGMIIGPSSRYYVHGPTSLHYRETPEDNEDDDNKLNGVVTPQPSLRQKNKKSLHDKYGFDIPRTTSESDNDYYFSSEEEIDEIGTHIDKEDSSIEIGKEKKTDTRPIVIKIMATLVMVVFTIFENLFSLAMYSWATLTMISLGLNIIGYGMTFHNGSLEIDTLEKMKSNVQFERQIYNKFNNEQQDDEEHYYEKTFLSPPSEPWKY